MVVMLFDWQIDRILAQKMVASKEAWELSVAHFDNFFVRCLLGNETFFLPPGAITQVPKP